MGEICTDLKALYKQLHQHFVVDTSPEPVGRADRIKRMRDNTLRKQLSEIAMHKDDPSTLQFSFGSLEGLNQTLGVEFGSSKDLEEKIHGMYAGILNQDDPKVSFAC